MRSIGLFSCPALALLLMLGSATAGEAWVEVGELRFAKKNVIGKVSVQLDRMRRRNGHYELWQRTVYATDLPGQAAVPEHLSEELTLWAIRCRRGLMAKLTERVEGSFLPRREALSFYLPAPDGASAAVVETACEEARRRFAEAGSAPDQQTAPGMLDTRATLERPPSLLNDLHDDDE